MDSLSIFEQGLKYQENFKNYLMTYIETYGFPCVYLTQDTETSKQNDYQLAFGGDKVGFDSSSKYYKRIKSKILIDNFQYSKLAIGSDTTAQVFIPSIDTVHTGDRLEIQMNGYKLLYGIDNAEIFSEIMYKFDLKFISKSK
jgi:hypothetical protein